MRDLVRGLVIGVAIVLVVGAIASRAGWAEVAAPRPSGTGPWQLARASGFAAFAALSFDVIVGLVVSTRIADRRVARGQLIELHSWLSPVALALVSTHAVALLADGYIRFDAVDVLVPFAAAYRPIAVGLGVLAAYIAVAVHASFALRRRLGAKTWRRLHYLSFVTFFVGALHGILAGSDSGHSWAIAMYATPLAVVSVLVTLRIGASLAVVKRGPRPIA